MTYYKVKPEFSNIRKRTKKFDFYIKDELYTEKEVIKQRLNRQYMEPIEISKRRVYFLFGARFKI